MYNLKRKKCIHLNCFLFVEKYLNKLSIYTFINVSNHFLINVNMLFKYLKKFPISLLLFC